MGGFSQALLRQIAAQAQAAGTHGDTILAHLSPDELGLLDLLADGVRDGGGRNPVTGLPTFGDGDGGSSNPGGGHNGDTGPGSPGSSGPSSGGGPSGGGSVGGNTSFSDNYTDMAGPESEISAPNGYGSYGLDAYGKPAIANMTLDQLRDETMSPRGSWSRLGEEIVEGLFGTIADPLGFEDIDVPTGKTPGIFGSVISSVIGQPFGAAIGLGKAMDRAMTDEDRAASLSENQAQGSKNSTGNEGNWQSTFEPARKVAGDDTAKPGGAKDGIYSITDKLAAALSGQAGWSGTVLDKGKGEMGSISQSVLRDDLGQFGRYGDTMVAHINPQEAALLQALGGSGSTNPVTGLPEFFTSSAEAQARNAAIAAGVLGGDPTGTKFGHDELIWDGSKWVTSLKYKNGSPTALVNQGNSVANALNALAAEYGVTPQGLTAGTGYGSVRYDPGAGVIRDGRSVYDALYNQYYAPQLASKWSSYDPVAAIPPAAQPVVTPNPEQGLTVAPPGSVASVAEIMQAAAPPAVAAAMAPNAPPPKYYGPDWRGSISQAYRDILGREAEQGGSDAYYEAMSNWFADNKDPVAVLRENLTNSDENQNRTIQGLYSSLLGRPGEAEGVQNWNSFMDGQLAAGQDPWAATRRGFLQSAEYDATQNDKIRQGYRDVLGREVESDAALNHWNGTLDNWMMDAKNTDPWGKLAKDLTNSDENQNNKIGIAYRDILGRGASADEVGGWNKQLDTWVGEGKDPWSAMTAGFKGSEEFRNRGTAIQGEPVTGTGLGWSGGTPPILGGTGNPTGDTTKRRTSRIDPITGGVVWDDDSDNPAAPSFNGLRASRRGGFGTLLSY